jgi:hypothetical protein
MASRLALTWTVAKTGGCRPVTLDSRLRRGTDRLGFVVTPAEFA